MTKADYMALILALGPVALATLPAILRELRRWRFHGLHIEHAPHRTERGRGSRMQRTTVLPRRFDDLTQAGSRYCRAHADS